MGWLLLCLWPVRGGTCGWGQLVLVVGVDSKCLLIPGLSVWTPVWVGSVRCWCGLLVWAVCGLLLAWDVEVVAWRSSSMWDSTTQSMFGFFALPLREGMNLLLQKQFVEK